MSQDVSQDALKQAAARAALAHVADGMVIGIGTGSTAEAFVTMLAEQVAQGFQVRGVPTSERTARLCVELGVPLTSLDEHPELDLTVDGADELDARLWLIKGGGGALLREKIVAASSRQMIVIADASKRVEMLGAFPLPVEINRFGMRSTVEACTRAARALGLDGTLTLRANERAELFETDGGHAIIDASFGRIPDPEALHAALIAIPGVVETGLFLNLCTMAIVADEAGITVMRPAS